MTIQNFPKFSLDFQDPQSPNPQSFNLEITGKIGQRENWRKIQLKERNSIGSERIYGRRRRRRKKKSKLREPNAFTVYGKEEKSFYVFKLE